MAKDVLETDHKEGVVQACFMKTELQFRSHRVGLNAKNASKGWQVPQSTSNKESAVVTGRLKFQRTYKLHFKYYLLSYL